MRPPASLVVFEVARFFRFSSERASPPTDNRQPTPTPSRRLWEPPGLEAAAIDCGGGALGHCPMRVRPSILGRRTSHDARVPKPASGIDAATRACVAAHRFPFPTELFPTMTHPHRHQRCVSNAWLAFALDHPTPQHTEEQPAAMWRSSGLLRRAAGAGAAGNAASVALRRAPAAAAAAASSAAAAAGAGSSRGLASDMSLLSLSELGDNAGAKQAVRAVCDGCWVFGFAGGLGVGSSDCWGVASCVRPPAYPDACYRTRAHPKKTHPNIPTDSGSAWGAGSGRGWARRAGGA